MDKEVGVGRVEPFYALGVLYKPAELCQLQLQMQDFYFFFPVKKLPRRLAELEDLNFFCWLSWLWQTLSKLDRVIKTGVRDVISLILRHPARSGSCEPGLPTQTAAVPAGLARVLWGGNEKSFRRTCTHAFTNTGELLLQARAAHANETGPGGPAARRYPPERRNRCRNQSHFHLHHLSLSG